MFASHLYHLLAHSVVRSFILILVETLNTLAQLAALPSTAVALAVLLKALALAAGALPHRLRLHLVHALVLPVHLLLCCVVAVLAEAHPWRADQSHAQTLAVVFLAF